MIKSGAIVLFKRLSGSPIAAIAPITNALVIPADASGKITPLHDRIPTISTITLPSTASHLPQDALAEMAGRMPHGAFATIEAGHCVHAERPGEFVDLVRSFFAGRLRAGESLAGPEGAADA